MQTRILLSTLVFYFFCIQANAQIIGSVHDGPNKVWNVRFVADVGLNTFFARASDAYKGERFIYSQDPDGTISTDWEWVEWDTIDKNILNLYKVANIRLGVLVNLYRNWYVGVNYNGYMVQGFDIRGVNQGYNQYVYWPFFSLSGSVNYEYRIPKFSRFALQPTLSLGTYQSNRLFEGVGRELSTEGRLGATFRIKKQGNNQLRAWLSYQRLWYRERNPSFVYEGRQRAIDTDWQFMTAGIGAVFHISIVEDKEDRVRMSRKEKRNARRQEKLEKIQKKLETKRNKN